MPYVFIFVIMLNVVEYWRDMWFLIITAIILIKNCIFFTVMHFRSLRNTFMVDSPHNFSMIIKILLINNVKHKAYDEVFSKNIFI